MSSCGLDVFLRLDRPVNQIYFAHSSLSVQPSAIDYRKIWLHTTVICWSYCGLHAQRPSAPGVGQPSVSHSTMTTA